MIRDLPEPSPLRTDAVTLVPVGDAHLELLYQVAVRTPACWPRLTAAGTPPAPRFADLVWRDVLAQYLAFDRTGVPRGLVAVHGADFAGRIAWLDCVDFSGTTPVASVEDDADLVASVLLVDYAFRAWPFHKLYRWETEGRSSALARRAVGTVEATFPDDLLTAGGYIDRQIVAIYSPEWNTGREELLGAIGAPVVDLGTGMAQP